MQEYNLGFADDNQMSHFHSFPCWFYLKNLLSDYFHGDIISITENPKTGLTVGR
jgi:hypothetical protein